MVMGQHWKIVMNSSTKTVAPRPTVLQPIEHRAAKVSLVTGLSTLLTIIFQLVSVPVCLHYWGKEHYGNWLALFSAFMLLRSLDAGLGIYVGNKLNYLYHLNVAEARRHLASAASGIAVIASVQLLLACSTLMVDPLARALGMSGGQAQDLGGKVGLVLLMASWATTGSYLGIIHRLQIPAGMMFQAAWWGMGFQATQFIAIMVAAMLRLGMLGTSVLFSISQIVIYISSALYVYYKLPEFFPLRNSFRWRTGLRDLVQSSQLTASNLIQQTSTNGVVLIVAALAGPVGIPEFTTVRTLMNLWTSVTTVLSSPLLPDVVRIHAKGEAQKLVPINQAFWVMVGSVVNFGTLLVYPLLPFVYGHWTTHAIPLDRSLLSLMLGAAVVTNAGALISLHLNGINSLGIILAASVARAVLGLGIGVIAFGRMGLASFGLGALVAETVVALMNGSYYMKRELAAKGARLPFEALEPALVSTGSAALFFLGAGFGWWSGTWIWLLAIAGVALGAVRGWRALDPALQKRLWDLPTRFYRHS
jgi:O-antigen/teichoic acid export membrane protein